MISLQPLQKPMTADATPKARASESRAWLESGLSRPGLGRFLRAAQEAIGLRGEVDVLLAGDHTLRRLNRQYRGKNKATDVLSFPAAPELAGGHAGDLAVSLETASRQAAAHGHTLRDEVRILLLHGLLHLYGMDHEKDDGEMRAREAELQRRLRLPAGLITRSDAAAPREKGGRRHGREAVHAGKRQARGRQ